MKKRLSYFHLLPLICGVSLFLGGCIIKPAQVPTRHFVLAPIPTPEHAPATAQASPVEVGVVKMPAYLLRDSMVVRKSGEEVEYLETALWAERLDQCFRHTLAENLSLLTSNRDCLASSERDRLVIRVSVTVEQFDVDSQGEGRLLAQWRLSNVGSNEPFKSGQARLLRTGPSPRGNPQAIATTMSALLAEFSQELAQALCESTRARN